MEETVETNLEKEYIQNPFVSVIIPTLNEERNIGNLLESLAKQTYKKFEIIVIDGGSKDKTEKICEKYGVFIKKIEMLGEFPSRIVGAEIAKGEILINTCADVIFPYNLIEKVVVLFTKDDRLVGLSGPGVPYRPPFWGKVEYRLYNFLRYVTSKVGFFSTSTNFLACPKEIFKKTESFKQNDINADGLMGRELSKMGKIKFDMNTCVCISSRRMWEMGFFRFNLWYIYVFENFLPLLSSSKRFQLYKKNAKQLHRESREK